MAKFRANTDDAYILTNIQNQESGDSDWVQYQVITKDKSRLILHNDTTNDLLKVFKDTTQAHDIFGDGSAVATYTFDGNANDLGGTYNGTLYGNPTFDTGKFGQAIKLNGTDDYVDTGYTHQGNTVTVSLWVNLNDNTSKQFFFGDHASNGAAYSSRVSLKINHVSGNFGFVIGDGSNYWLDNSSISHNLETGYWYHLVYVVNDTSVKLYVDEQLVADLTSSIALSNGERSISIGRSGALDNYYTNGLIDQVRIFNRALTEDEVAFLYHEGLTHIRKHDQLIIYNATDGTKIHEVTSITDNDTDKTYDIDISSLSLTEAPTNAHQLTKSVDLTDKIDTSNTTATTLVLQDTLENTTLVKNGETLVIDGYKLENINVTRSLYGGNVKYNVDISSLNLTQVPSEVILIKSRVEISVDDEDKANADDLVLDVDTNNTTTTQIVTNYMSINDSQSTRIRNVEKIDTDTGLDLSLIEVVEEYLDPTKVDPFNDNSEVAFYQLDGNANDAHNQYNGTWHGTEQYDTGMFGQAAKFDGSSWIDATSIPESITASNWSWSCWVNLSNFNGQQICVNGRNLPTNGSNDRKNGCISIYNNEIRHTAKGSSDSNQIVKTVSVTDFLLLNTWYLFTYVLEGNIHKVYINGELISELTITTNGSVELVDGVGFELFRHHYSGETNNYATGLRDQVRIFNRALTEDEIKYLYNEGKYKFNLNLQTEQSSAPTKAIIRPTIQDILELDPNNTAYDNTNDLVNVHYQPVQKGNGFRSVQVKWNAHRQGDENNSLRVNLWKKVA